MEKKILVITGANTAREIGYPKPKEEDYEPSFTYLADLELWESRESSLKEYSIIGKTFYNADSEIIAIDPTYWIHKNYFKMDQNCYVIKYHGRDLKTAKRFTYKELTEEFLTQKGLKQ